MPDPNVLERLRAAEAARRAREAALAVPEALAGFNQALTGVKGADYDAKRKSIADDTLGAMEREQSARAADEADAPTDEFDRAVFGGLLPGVDLSTLKRSRLYQAAPQLAQQAASARAAAAASARAGLDVQRLAEQNRHNLASEGNARTAADARAKIAGSKGDPADVEARKYQARADVKRVQDLSEGLARAGNTRALLERARELHGQLGATGPIAGRFTPSMSSAAQELNTVLSKLRTAQAPKGQGAVSDFERRLYAAAVPGAEVDADVAARIYDQLLAELDHATEADRQLYEGSTQRQQSAGITGQPEVHPRGPVGAPSAATAPVMGPAPAGGVPQDIQALLEKHAPRGR